MEQIFVSYSRADKDFVDRLALDVENAEGAKFNVWTDRADISGGDDWATKIGAAIRTCSYFLLVLSPSSAKSRKVWQEAALADKHDKRIVPLMYQSCDIPEELELPLARQQLIDFTQNYNEALQRLCGALGQKAQTVDHVRSPPPLPPPPPPQLSLMQILPGQWIATATYPMMPQITVSAWMAPDGSFRAQQLPMGVSSQGQWSVDQSNQVHMQGLETNGFVTAPFATSLRVLTFDQNQISGLGPFGEQVYWRRVG